MRTTVVTLPGGPLDGARLSAAAQQRQGVHVTTIERLAERMAGGFLRSIDGESLSDAVTAAIQDASHDEHGDLQAIMDLPGLPRALAGTLTKAWSAGIALDARAAAQPGARLQALAALERAVLAGLPPAALRPVDLVSRALERIEHAPAVLGPVEIRALPDLAPCWRPLVLALASRVPVTWNAGPRPVPAWLHGTAVKVAQGPAATPELQCRSCATARHEVIEAMRWARGLLAGGTVRADQIAFAAAAPGDYDDLVLAIGDEANLDLHFSHGRRALATRAGQAAAALADLLLRGLSQDRVKRLAAMADEASPLGGLAEGWRRHLPSGAPLGTPKRWRQALEATQAPGEMRDVLLPVVDLLAGGTGAAAEAGETLLRGQSRLLWRRALAEAPASALESSLGALRVPDGTEPASSIAWMNASALAACPRPFVWLFGLNARVWPRSSGEDPLLPAHVVPMEELDPLPVTASDRQAFHTICATTERQVTCSFSRRDATGRLLGPSPLLPPQAEVVRLRRARVPDHAMSEQDRLMARPAEFAASARAVSAQACWRDWHNPTLTPHDGLVRAGHPALRRAVDRVHSATSLKLLLRNPAGFAWRYALGWREPESGEEAMDLDARAFGDLVHGMLDHAVRLLERDGSLDASAGSGIDAAVGLARATVAARWEAEHAVPPATLWAMRLREAEAMARRALGWPMDRFAGQRSHSEVAFAGSQADEGAPWDVLREVPVPGTGLKVSGRIDRLDIAGDGSVARVVDYKTGKPREPGILAGGAELQRCLYAYAVGVLLGGDVRVEAALLYPREDGGYHALEDAGAALETLTRALSLARDGLLDGLALPGIDCGGERDDFRFVLPATPGCLTEQKREAARARMGDAATIWDEP